MSEAPRVQRFTEPSGSTILALAPGVAGLSVMNTAGAITLRGSDRADLRIAWTKRGEPGTPEWDGLELEVGQTADRISVRPRHPERKTRSAGAWIDLEIEMPAVTASLAVEIENGAGDATATGVACASFRLLVASGDAHMRDIAAEIRIQSAYGDISANAIAGDLTVRTASGDVAILGHRRGAIAIDTASGDVRWRPDGVADARIRTVSGDIVAELGTGSGWRIDFRSVSGRASLPTRFAPAGRKAWVAGGATAGSGSIEARTVSGDFRVIEVAAAAGDGPAPHRDEPRHDRDAILRAVERGDLGVDDALRLLDDVPGGAQPA